MTGGVAEPDRKAETPIWLQGGFRLLFTGGALWALVVVALWVGALAGNWTLPTAMDPLAWHQHEMLFGYLGAVIAGFLSAAIPNWNGRPVVTGWPVAAFVGLWAAARLAVLFSATVSPIIGAALDVGFLLMLIAIIGGLIIKAFTRNWLARQGHADGLPTMANRFDHAVLAAAAIALAAGRLRRRRRRWPGCCSAPARCTPCG